MWLRSPRYRRLERRVIAAAQGTGIRVRWVADEGTGNSDHREFSLAGAPAAKLGVPDEPCRHNACDTPDRLRRTAFARVLKVVWPLVRTYDGR